MAMNLQTLRTRSLTAAVFVIVMLGGLFWNQWSFIALFTIIHFGAWYEFVKLMKKIFPSKYIYYLPLGLFYITMPVLMMLQMGGRATIVHGTFVGEYGSGFKTEFSFGYSYIIPCTIIFSIWINDTMAYIVGSLIGKTPFSKISPKKTWEGTAGGAILCVIVISLIAYFSKLISVKDAVCISAICAIFGTAGDLLESKIKRMANVKDSGSFMPGHGGFLDRFDSLLIAVPFVWLYLYVSGF
ncbi:MAG: phosphatidate cytidylyltransferase [Ferruginibacter sp.]